MEYTTACTVNSIVPSPAQIWKDVPDYEGLYQASNFGRVKSLERISTYLKVDTLVDRYKEEKIVSQSIDRKHKGYLVVGLSKNGKVRTHRVHRVIANSFISNPHNLPQINHIDGNKCNNCLYNLEWCDGVHNMQHAFKNNLVTRNYGGRNGMARLIVDTETGVFYDSIREAAVAKSISYFKLAKHLNGETKNKTSLIYA